MIASAPFRPMPHEHVPELANVFWSALCGHHARFSEGTRGAKRYARGFTPLLGFADIARPDFVAIEPHVAPGEQLYVEGWSGPVPPGWHLHVEATVAKMVWDGGLPDAPDMSGIAAFRREHAQQALDLAKLTKPGPFGIRTPELGEYFGCFDDGRLVAMAGERMHAGSFREISGVCTHPDHAGRGHARRLMHVVIRREMARGERPFLHVMAANAPVRAFYRRMGFREYRESVLRVVSLA